MYTVNYTTINATKFRNNVFQILDEFRQSDKVYRVEKDNIPLAYLVPINTFEKKPEVSDTHGKELQAKIRKVEELAGGLNIGIKLSAEELDNLYDQSYDE